MKDINEYEKDLASIRTMMERSVKFLSLSGLSGILSGTYALLGSVAVYGILYYPNSLFGYRLHPIDENPTVIKVLLIAGSVLILSISTGYLLSVRKSKKLKTPIWNFTSKQLLRDLLTPLISGGLLMSILLAQGYYGIIAPSCLVFYGLALIQAGRSTYEEVKYLGATEIVLGLMCALFPDMGLFFWAVGFGVMHIIYGAVMYFRYDR